MANARPRSLAIDFFRGLALIVIAIDHVRASLLSHITLHTWAWCDAAEAFVFIGGFASASAWLARAERASEQAANARFYRRGWEIYRAYLLSAALMLAIGLSLGALYITNASNPADTGLAPTESAVFLRRPAGWLWDVLTLRRQPYLASVLPMYAAFALGTPLFLKLAASAPWFALAASFIVWCQAPFLASFLPSAYPEGWAFNPFAWQFLFALGMLTRLRPISEAWHAGAASVQLTRLACCVVLGLAFWKIFLVFEPTPGYLKQNLSLLRVVNFIALAWLAAALSRTGLVQALARRLPMVVTIGKQGLACFVGGAAISVIVDVVASPLALRASPWMVGLGADLITVSALYTVARVAGALKAKHARVAACAQPMSADDSRRTAMLHSPTEKGGGPGKP